MCKRTSTLPLLVIFAGPGLPLDLFRLFRLILKEVEGLLGHDQVGVGVIVKVVLLQTLQGLPGPPLTRGIVQNPPDDLALRAMTTHDENVSGGGGLSRLP